VHLSPAGVIWCANHVAGRRSQEKKYPYIVELFVADDKLDVEVNRRMMDFHRSRKIPARYGLTIIREGQIYYRWCFSDLETTHAFMEQFDGEVLQSER
jgi:hypothetical protein